LRRFAQQSVRENARTGRTPQHVMDEALWGADGDHLKSANDIAAFVAAGYTFFTVDPGEYVDHAASGNSIDLLEQKTGALPWSVLQDSMASLRACYLNQVLAPDGLALTFTDESLVRAAV
jgi:tagaturonate epimerase